MAKRYILNSEIDRIKAKHKDFELQLPAAEKDGVSYKQAIVSVRPLRLQPDDVLPLINAQPVRAARLILGDHYAHFLAAGGAANILFDIMSEHENADLGESSPSAAS